MATRMQQRRGTAAQWISTNSGNGPILAAGEIGYESDTNKFKIGDGTNTWLTLDYFIDADSTVNPQFGSSIKFEGATANDFETTLAVTDPTADRTITLPDSTGTVVLADGSGNVTVSGNLTVSGTTTTINSTTINATTGIVFEGATANDFETTLTVTDPTADRTVTFQDATGTVVLRDSTDTLTNKSISLGSNTVTSTLAQLNTAVTDADVASLAGTETLTNKTLTSPTISGLYLSDASIVLEGATADGFETTLTVTDPTANRTLTFPNATGTIAITTDISDAITNAALDDSDDLTEGTQNLFYTTARSDLKANLAGATFTGAVSGTSLTLSGDLTVNGTTTTINSTTLAVDDKNIVLGDVATPSDATADGGGITLKGATDKTFNWVDATDSWTSSDHLNLASGKSYYVNGTLLKDVTETLTNKTLTSPALTTPTISTLTTAGDLLYGSGSGVLTRLGIGSSTQVLTVVGGVPAWAAGGSAADDDQPILASQIFG
jgi:hypothetical protein